MNEIVPESSDHETDKEDENAYVPETPQKDGSPAIKSHSIIPIPSLNRIRKSLGVLDTNVGVFENNTNTHSPKNRRGTENRVSNSASKKSAKLRNHENKYSNLQKVKVSLFHRFKENEPAEKPSFSVSAKSFYGSSSKKPPEPYALAPVVLKPVTRQSSTKKRSPPAPPVVKKRSPTQSSAMKKHKRKGEINCGVAHGIKRPKRKRSSLKNHSMDSNKSLSGKQNSSITEEQSPIRVSVDQIENFDSNNVIESSTVETYDPKKKFFKHNRRKVEKSATVVSLPVECQATDLLEHESVNKKLCTDKTSIVTEKPGTEIANVGSNEHLCEENDESMIQPLITQKDFDDWNRLSEAVNFDISDTNMSSLESIDPVQDLLKILEEDWIGTTVNQTASMSIVNSFSKESNTDILDVSSGNEGTLSNLRLSNMIGQPAEYLEPTANGVINDANSSDESIVITLGLNDTINLPMENSLSASAVIESYETNLSSCGHVNKQIVDTESLVQNASNSSKVFVNLMKNQTAIENVDLKTVPQKDVNDLLNILQDDWREDIEPAENPTFVESDTLSNAIETNQNICNSTLNKESILETITNDTVKSQNSGALTEQANKKYYPLFSKGYSCGIATDMTTKSKGNNENRILAKHNSDAKQYQIDAGQKLFGVIQCKECQLPYHLGDKDDEKVHIKYHNQWKKDSGLKFQGWKNERIVFQDSSTKSKIILIEPSDPMSHRKKVLDILQIINEDLGLMEVNASEYVDDKVYLYVKNQTIIGLVISKRIHRAFKIIPESPEQNCCSSESSPAKCGINVVWTAKHYRRQGIATKLVDVLRTNYFYGYLISIDDIAFSVPTPSGKAFAKKYTKTSSFKVY